MHTDDSHLDEIYERFNQAIMRAIVNSREVQDLLREIGSQGYINESSVFNLFLSLEELDDYMNPGSSDSVPAGPAGTGDADVAPDGGPEAGAEAPPRIDGHALTDTETRFLEYCARHFDERKWLKKARLKL